MDVHIRVLPQGQIGLRWRGGTALYFLVHIETGLDARLTNQRTLRRRVKLHYRSNVSSKQKSKNRSKLTFRSSNFQKGLFKTKDCDIDKRRLPYQQMQGIYIVQWLVAGLPDTQGSHKGIQATKLRGQIVKDVHRHVANLTIDVSLNRYSFLCTKYY